MHQAVFQAIARQDRPVVVFDIDSTLVSTASRHLAILREFADVHGSEALQRRAADLTAADFGWTVDGPVDVDDATRKALEAFWFERFFASAYLVHDTPTPGAVPFVRAVREAGAHVHYLTARTAETMGRGTLEHLHRMGFPLLDGGCTVHLKPHRGLADHAFKAAALDAAARLGDVVATFENEPANAHLFEDRFPNAVHVLLDTVHSPEAPHPRPSLVVVSDFR